MRAVVNAWLPTDCAKTAHGDPGMQAAAAAAADVSAWIAQEDARWGPILKGVLKPQ